MLQLTTAAARVIGECHNFLMQVLVKERDVWDISIKLLLLAMKFQSIHVGVLPFEYRNKAVISLGYKRDAWHIAHGLWNTLGLQFYCTSDDVVCLDSVLQFTV